MANEIRGTDADDLITGTSGDDEIKTFDGDDIVIAGAGDDVVYTGLGEDRLEGGAGDDYLVSNEGNDILLGGAGSDRLFGCEDDDILDGGAGQDFLNAGIGNDTLIFTAAENAGDRAPDYYSGLEGMDTLVLQLTQAEFQAAQGDIQAFLSYIEQTTGANGESTGPFFHFQTLNLAVQQVENLRIIVADEVVFNTDPVANDDSFETSEQGVLDGDVSANDDVNAGSTFTIVQNVSRGTLVLNADGSFSFDTNGAFDSLGDGETATETFTYRVSSPNSDDVTATATITIVGQNDAPVVTAISAEESEDAPSFIVDLLAGASDADSNDTLSVTNVRIDDGTGPVDVNAEAGTNGVQAQAYGASNANSISGSNLSIDLSLYQYLAVGETLVLTVTYDVTDGSAVTSNTAVLTIIGENDIPTVISGLSVTASESDGPIALDMLTGASDIDTSDVLSVSDFTVVSGNAAGLVQNGSTLTFDPSAYSSLLAGQSETIIVAYDILDGNGGVVQQTATITVNGEGAAPMIVSGLDISTTEDAAPISVLLTDGITDADGDALSVINLTGLSDGLVYDAATFELSLDPGSAFFQSLAVGQSASYTLTYDVTDGTDGTVSRTTTIEVQGVNDAPVVAAPITIERDESDAVSVIDLLAGASDIDAGDVLSIANFTIISGDGNGLIVSGTSLELDPSVYAQLLNTGESEVITVTYDVVDGNGGITAQTAVITVNGAGVPPVNSTDLNVFALEDSAPLSVLLTDGVTDADGDALSVVNLMGLGAGLSYDAATFELSLDPSDAAFQSLAAGQLLTYTLTYDVIDGNGGSVSRTTLVDIEGVNDDPIVAAPITAAFNETDTVSIIDLLQGASDVDAGDVLSIANFTITSGDGSGLTVSGTELTVDPIAYAALNTGQSEVITVTYDVVDGNGGIAAQTATITVNGVGTPPAPGSNTPPVEDTVLAVSFSEDDMGPAGPVVVSLLQGVSDADGDPLTAVNVTFPALDGVTFNAATSSIVVDTSFFQSLAPGENSDITVSFDVIDGNGGSVSRTGTITIVGANDDPDPGAPIDLNFNQNDSFVSIDLLAQASDIDNGDFIIGADNFVVTSGNDFGVQFSSGVFLDIQPSAYTSLGAGESEVVTFTYEVFDDNGGVSTNTGTVTIEGENDDPIAGATINETYDESDSLSTIDLLLGASDIDISDVLDVDNFTITSGDGGGLSFSGTSLDVDPSAYSALNNGETEVITFSYDIIDGNGGTVTNTGTITINGESSNSPPISNEFAQIFVTEGGGTTFAGAAQGASDPDGDMLTAINLPTLPGWLTFDAVTQIFTANEDDPVFDTLRDGQFLDFSFTYDLSDGNGGTVGHGLNVSVDGSNDDPVVAAPLTLSIMEDNSVDFLNLLTGATDVDSGDILSIRNVTGLNSGFLLDYATGDLNIETTDEAFDFIRVGETFDFVISYEIHDLFGGMTTQTATITVEGFNDLPRTQGALSATVLDLGTGGARVFNLLQGAEDPENTALTVGNIVSSGILPTSSLGNPVFVFDAAAGTLTVDTTGYNVASIDENYTITFDITDADGGVTTQTIDITIQFEDPPTTEFPTTSPIVFNATEDTLPVLIDLLLGASDPDGDTLTVTNIDALPSGMFSDGATPNIITFIPGAFDYLNVGETLNAVINYTIEDGNGGFVDNTLTITITGVNDAPINFATITATFNEDDGLVRVDLLESSTDLDDGDVLNADGLSLGGLQATLFDGSRFLGIELDDFAYQSLSAGESADFNISFQVDDLNGGSTTQTGTITVVGANDVAVAQDENDREFNFDDNDASFSDDLSAFINEIDTNDAYTLDAVSFVSGTGLPSTPTFSFSGGVFTFDPSQFGPFLQSMPVSATFSFTATSGPDTVTSTFTIFIEGTIPGQQPLDEKGAIDIYEPGPPVIIIKDGPDGVYSEGLSDSFDFGDSTVDDSFDFADDATGDILPVMPSLDDGLLTEDISSEAALLTKAMALDAYDGDPPLKMTVFDGMQSYEIDLDVDALI